MAIRHPPERIGALLFMAIRFFAGTLATVGGRGLAAGAADSGELRRDIKNESAKAKARALET
jgi:hypothetical protein